MKRQQFLDSYFRVKAKPAELEVLKTSENLKNKSSMDNEKLIKKRSLSIQKNVICAKSPKIETTAKVPSFILNDSENSPESSDLSLPDSDTTVIYSPPSAKRTSTKFGTPKSGAKSGSKIFSPVRNRLVYKRSPKKAVKNLTFELNKEVSPEDEQFTTACEGYNDITKFLLKIIHKFLKNDSLTKFFEKTELQLLSKSFNTIKPGMMLVCRLYWQQERWQKKLKLCKITESVGLSEAELCQVIDSLIQNGFLIKADNQANKMTFDDLIDVLKLEELKKVGKDLLKKNFKTKDQVVEALKNFSKLKVTMNMFIKGSNSTNMSRLLKIMSEAAGDCYKLSDLARTTLYKLYLISFLGMDYSIIREKNLELVLLHDKLNRETYPIDKSMELDDASVVFRNRTDFNKFLAAHNLYEEFLKLTDTTDKCKVIEEVYQHYKNISEEDMNSYKSLPSWLRRYTPANIFIRILSTGIQDLKRTRTEEKYRLCVDILSLLIEQSAFRQHKKADWYSEKALVLFMLQEYDEAAKVLLSGFNSSMPSEDKDILRARAKKIANQKNISVSDDLKQELLVHATTDDLLEKNLHGEHIFKNRVENRLGRGKVKFITKTEDGLVEEDAERCCITHYVEVRGEYTHGEHWEGRIVNTIFFLLFWDIIYHRLHGYKGIYLCHFQKYPLDMFTDSFYLNRKTLIEDRLKEIDSWSEERLIDFMHENYMSRPETELSPVTRIDWPLVRDVVSCLGGAATGALCRQLARDYRRNHSGFPDLTLWHTDRKKIKFVEVKTDTDKPSMKQIQWMHYLRENNIDTEFCYIGTNTTRCKARSEIKTKENTTTEAKVKEELNNSSTSSTEVRHERSTADEENARKELMDSSIQISDDDSSDFDVKFNIENNKTVAPSTKLNRKSIGPRRKVKKELKTDDIDVKKEIDNSKAREKRVTLSPKQNITNESSVERNNTQIVETDVDSRKRQEDSRNSTFASRIEFEDDLDGDLCLLLVETEIIVID